MFKPSKKEKEEGRKKVNAYVRFSGMAFQMGGIIFVGVWGGMKLDEIFQYEQPWFTIGLSLTAVFAALYQVIKQVISIGKEDEST